MKLNKKQLAVLEYTKGNAVVQAGPGTGKTTTLIAYSGNLIDNHTITIKFYDIGDEERQPIFNSIEQSYL